MFSVVKKVFGESAFYCWLRGLWYAHLREIPRRRLRRYGYQILKTVYDTLGRTPAVYFVDYGTMLGIVRENDFIRHDDDVDITIIAGSISPAELARTISACEGFSFSHAFEYRGQITEMTFLYKQIEVDFFFTFREGDHMLSFAYRPPPGPFRRNVGDLWSALGVTRCLINGIETRMFKGVCVEIPKNYKEVLRDQYGNWEVPISGWQPQEKGLNTPRIYYKDFSRVVNYVRVLEVGNESQDFIRPEL